MSEKKLWHVELNYDAVVLAVDEDGAAHEAEQAFWETYGEGRVVRSIEKESDIPCDWADEVPLGTKHGEATCLELFRNGGVEPDPKPLERLNLRAGLMRGKDARLEFGIGCQVAALYEDCPNCKPGQLGLLFWRWDRQIYCVVICGVLSCLAIYFEGAIPTPENDQEDVWIPLAREPRRLQTISHGRR